MSALERDLRRMLRWYPRHWRDEHGDALVGLHLDMADGDGSTLSRQDRAALRAAGLFERTRTTLPVVAAVGGTASVALGMALATIGIQPLGPLLWLLAGPALLSLSFWGMRASGEGRWGFSVSAPFVASVMAAFALASTFWVAVLRDNVDAVVPGLNVLWAMALLYMGFVGVAFAISVGPLFARGMARDWALTLSFFSGFFGALFIALALLSGLVAVLAGLALTYAAIRTARGGSRTSTAIPVAG
jgi:hypothetical protein